MKNGKKIFILVETFLGLMVFVLVMFMFLEKNEKKQEKISVIIQNSDDSQWAAFKYGAKMAAADKKTEVFVVSTAGSLSVQEEENLIEREIANGASGIIVEPANGEKTEKMLKEVEKKVPVVLVESLASSDGTETKMPVTGADNYAMGKALAEELLKDCGGNIKGKKIGLVSGEENAEAISERAEGVRAVLEEKQADKVAILLMNPQNGEILAMVNVPEFDLNEPFTLNQDQEISEKSKEALNQMWRNGCINDTYEPGSTFKIITASACLEERVVSLADAFSCPGYRIVEDRKIRCHKVGGHGAETFVQGIQNSCNPVFIDIGLRLGTGRFCDYFEQFGLLGKTGVDLPGEAATIMHKEENIGQVELATMSFGQSFQVTPIQMAATVSALVNGGKRVTPHFGVRILDKDKETVRELKYDDGKQIVSEETSRTMQALLESVVSEGSGKNAKIEGYHIGGKTATSQTLPRSANKYISSFIGFAPAANPQILGMCVIYNPQGVYYGGTIAAPVIRDIFDNIFPYLGIEKDVEMQYTN